LGYDGFPSTLITLGAGNREHNDRGAAHRLAKRTMLEYLAEAAHADDAVSDVIESHALFLSSEKPCNTKWASVCP
jgi:hypothetical protein